MKSILYYSLTIIFTITLFTACKKSGPAPAPPKLAEVITTPVSAIEKDKAVSGGNVSTDNGFSVTSRGVVWSTSTGPTVSLSTKTSDGIGTGSFSSNLTNLTASTKYYIRAYATNSAGTAYGDESSFTTLANVGLPGLNTSAISSITATTAQSGGNITADNNGTITARGIVWSTTTAPTISLSTKTSDGAGKGSFTSNLTGLTPGTKYYVRAYATNSAGTSYGNEVSFSTSAGTLTVTTDKVQDLGFSVSIIASVIGTLEVIEMGICYSTSPSPTISNTKVTKTFPQAFNNGGSFNVSISGTACVKYYARAYATVKGGTTYYGNELTFTHVGPLNDCHPFNGNWRNSANTITWSGNANDFRFRSIASIPELNWRGALDAKLISIGSVYVNNIVKTGQRTWTCNVLWNKGSTSNNIITEVKYGAATLTLSSDGNQITIAGNSPWPPGSSSVTLTKL